MIWKVAALLAAAFAVATPAWAQTVTASDPDSIVQALQAGGYRAELKTDEFGDPQIDSAASGSNFSIFFFDCTDHRDCGAIQFHASYEMDAPTAERIAEWNRTKRYGRAFISTHNFTTMEMDILLDPGGMSRELFLSNIELWSTLQGEFEDHVGWD